MATESFLKTTMKYAKNFRRMGNGSEHRFVRTGRRNVLFRCQDDETVLQGDNGQQPSSAHSSVQCRATHVRLI